MHKKKKKKKKKSSNIIYCTTFLPGEERNSECLSDK